MVVLSSEAQVVRYSSSMLQLFYVYMFSEVLTSTLWHWYHDLLCTWCSMLSYMYFNMQFNQTRFKFSTYKTWVLLCI